MEATEKDWQQTVVEAAGYLGYAVYHTYDSTRSAPGFPDLTLVRPKRLVFLECKTNRGRLSRDQLKWLELLHTVEVVACGISRPNNWEETLALLRGEEWM